MKFFSFNSIRELNVCFAKRLGEILSEAIHQRGHAYLVVSGGRTPISLFKELASISLEWQHVTITLADERCVPSSHQDSNEHLVRSYLLQGHASPATFISLSHNINSDLLSLPTFDAVVLGMGEDGHTASLFPCSEEIAFGLSEEIQTPVLMVHPKTAPYSRISMTKKRLLTTRHLFLHVVGDNKRKVLEKAANGACELEMPIKAFLQHANPEMHVLFCK